jgi:SpoIIAA-like
MPATLHHEGDNTYRLDVNGVLSKDDLDRVQELLLKEMDRTDNRTARLLVVLEGFEGWDSRNSNWGDLTFFVKHGDRLERIAIVGNERWRDHALMFAAADLRRGPVEFFASDAMSDARAWLSGV